MKIQSSALKALILLGSALTTSGAVAQISSSIRFDAQTKIFRIDAAGITYAFGVNAQDQLQSIYWGHRSAGMTCSEAQPQTLVLRPSILRLQQRRSSTPVGGRASLSNPH
jgi:hypothetical protein